MNVEQVKAAISQAAATLQKEERYLSMLDAQTGDGDHGVTMGKISGAIINACADTLSEDTLGGLFDKIYTEVMKINGGSAGPLWAQMFSGIAETAGAARQLDRELLKKLYQGALEGLEVVSNAKAGEKTMKDALEPAAQAAKTCTGSGSDILEAAAKAAEQGAEATKNMIAKYGRAKYLKEDSLGYVDPGAVSVSVFLRALAQSCR